MRKLPPIRIYRERIDDQTIAVVAYCFEVRWQRFWDNEARQHIRRPILFGVSLFHVCESHRNYFGRQEAEERVLTIIREQGRLPYIGPCSETPGWSDFAD